MNATIDQVIAEAEKVPASATETVETPAAEVEQASTEENSEPQDEAAKSEADVPFPKKAVNAISRRDKTIGKQRAEIEHLRAELAKINPQANSQQPTANKSTPNADNSPNENDFDTYGEYLKAVARFEARQELSANTQKQQETEQNQQFQAWYEERSNAVAQQANEFLAATPDAKEILTEYADVLDSFSPALERIFLQADNAPLAFYNLAKEGKLETLMSMPLEKAAMEIGRAQLQQPPAASKKPITNAPTPISGAKGSGQGSKLLDNLSSDELREWLKT